MCCSYPPFPGFGLSLRGAEWPEPLPELAWVLQGCLHSLETPHPITQTHPVHGEGSRGCPHRFAACLCEHLGCPGVGTWDVPAGSSSHKPAILLLNNPLYAPLHKVPGLSFLQK